MIEDGTLYDVAAMPIRGVLQKPQGTCAAPGAKHLTRRDYGFVTPQLTSLIQAVEVDDDGGFYVHRPLRIEMKMKKAATIRRLVTFEPLDESVPRDEKRQK